MPKKTEPIVLVQRFFQTAPLEQATLALSLAKDAIAQRRPATPKARKPRVADARAEAAAADTK